MAAGGTEAERVTDALDKLGEMGIQSILLEGGPRLAGSFLDAGEIDEMRLFIAPIALGGRGARMSFEGEGADTIEHAQQRGLDARRARSARRADRGAAQRVVGATAQPGLTVRCSPGIVQELGRVAAVARDGEGCACRIEAALAGELTAGDSVSVNGVCLTAVEPGDGRFAADLSPETLARSALGDLAGAIASTSSCRCGRRTGSGGHIVQGHVDGVGTMEAVERRRMARDVRFSRSRRTAALRRREGLGDGRRREPHRDRRRRRGLLRLADPGDARAHQPRRGPTRAAGLTLRWT